MPVGMETFGLIGFVFALSAMSMATTATKKAADLEKRLEALEQKGPDSTKTDPAT